MSHKNFRLWLEEEQDLDGWLQKRMGFGVDQLVQVDSEINLCNVVLTDEHGNKVKIDTPVSFKIIKSGNIYKLIDDSESPKDTIYGTSSNQQGRTFILTKDEFANLMKFPRQAQPAGGM